MTVINTIRILNVELESKNEAKGSRNLKGSVLINGEPTLFSISDSEFTSTVDVRKPSEVSWRSLSGLNKIIVRSYINGCFEAFEIMRAKR